MSISNYLENKVLDKVFRNTDFTVTTAYVALHSGDPGETGTNEVTGGSYARQSATFDIAASGHTANSGNVTFTGMPAVSGDGVVGVSIWDASSAGNCLWTGFLAAAPKAFSTTDTAGDTVQCPAHGFVADDRVVFDAEVGGTLPTGISSGTLYWVRSGGLTTDVFTVSTTQGGAAVNITAAGQGFVRKVSNKTTNSGDTFQINTGDLDIDLF